MSGSSEMDTQLLSILTAFDGWEGFIGGAIMFGSVIWLVHWTLKKGADSGLDASLPGRRRNLPGGMQETDEN